jgi:glycosyltransferase involved in cell wall biosynthesis
MNSQPPIVVGIVTYNNLPMIQKCFESWRRIPNTRLVIWDNGSDPETVAWLREQKIDKLFLNAINAGLCVGRNRIIEHSRETELSPFILLMDSDVLFHEGSLDLMLETILSDESIGMVGFGQANHGFPATAQGFVEEASNECILSRISMWREIGLFPESLAYYSSDSWKSTLASMHGWKTKLISSAKGYDHFAHGSHVNKEVPVLMAKDMQKWATIERNFESYWRQRLILGKRGVVHPSGDPDALVDEETLLLDGHDEVILKPSLNRQYTSDYDVKALLRLFKRVRGNYLELGCHRGLTLMQFCYNFPDAICYGVDSSDGAGIPSNQRTECPRREEIGSHVRAFKNACVFDQKIENFLIGQLDDVAFVFIDSDHTYEGVKAATEKVLHHFYRQTDLKKRIIAWHDYIPKSQINEEHPAAWIGVGDYVRTEVAPKLMCRWIRGTTVAYAVYVPDLKSSLLPRQ